MNKIGAIQSGNDCCVREVTPLQKCINTLKEEMYTVEESLGALYQKIDDSGLLLSEPCCDKKAESGCNSMSNVEYEIYAVTGRLVSLKERINLLRSEYRG